MSFADRLTRCPIAHNTERAEDVLLGFPQIRPELRDLLFGTAGSSPYLAGLIAKEAEWLVGALEEAPEATVTSLIEQARLLTPEALDAGLRRLKRKAALIVGLADLGGVWGLEQVTQSWTAFADACTSVALTTHVGKLAKRGKIPGVTEEEALQDGGGMVALAMGKMGAGELNYSSDIDLICLFDETRFDSLDEEMEARAAFIKATRALAASLNDVTAQGYVFRTDLRLRPDASVTPVCISMAAAERYYEAEGRTWERSAYIKARPAAGDLAAGARFLEDIRPFVWRRHLDFAAVAETMDMRQRIRDHKGLHGRALEGRDLKLGTGGIREIEFFAQTRQLVAGGRDPSLRQPRTIEALDALAKADWISQEVASKLITHYRSLREAEHRLQMMEDAQTHSLPQNDAGFDRLARLSGWSDTAAFRDALHARLAEVEELTGDLYKSKARQSEQPQLSDESRQIVAAWPGYPALKSQRGREIFERLKPDLLSRFAAAARPDEALTNFDRFLRGLPAGVQLFSLFEANPTLVDLLVDICVTAPGLATYLSRNSSVLDAVLDGRFFSPWPGAGALGAELGTLLARQDFETQLDLARRFQREWHFRIGVHLLRGLISPPEAALQYSDLAECIVASLWQPVCDEVARKHGPAPGRGGVVLAMGSFGAREMSAGSDLDLIVIYDAQGVEFTTGRRPLDPRGWFAKATKSLITALSAATAEGRLYEVDMRLRPSGRQGPVATGFEAFKHYQMNEAWVWEHMALTRARVVAGSADLGEDVEQVRRQAIEQRRGDERVFSEAAQMAQRLANAPRKGEQIKDGPGGLQQISLFAQAVALVTGNSTSRLDEQLGAGLEAGLIDPAEARSLTRVYASMSALLQGVRLLGDGGDDEVLLSEGARAFLKTALDMTVDVDLMTELNGWRDTAALILTPYLTPNETENEDEPRD